MKRRHLPITFATVLCIAHVAQPGNARAQGVETSKELLHFEKGVQFYRAGAYDAAVIEFEAAYAAAGNFKHLYNIGVCRQELREYPEAIEAFTRYLSQGGAQIDAKRREEVNEQLTQIRALVRRVVLVTKAPAGAEVYVDDVKVGTTPIGPVSVKVGQRKIAIASGGRTVTKMVVVASGSLDLPVELNVTDSGDGPQAATPLTTTAERPSFPIVPWVVTAGAGAGAVLFGVLAVTRRNRQGELEGTFGVDPQEIRDAASDAKTFALVGDLFTVGTLLSAGVATYFTVRYARAVSRPTAKVDFGPSGVLVRGTF